MPCPAVLRCAPAPLVRSVQVCQWLVHASAAASAQFELCAQLSAGAAGACWGQALGFGGQPLGRLRTSLGEGRLCGVGRRVVGERRSISIEHAIDCVLPARIMQRRG